MRRRLTIAGALVALVLPVATVATAGGGDGPVGPLRWADARAFEHPALPVDRIITGTLRNAGRGPVRVDVTAVRLLAADGSVVPAQPVFLHLSGRALWAPGRGAAVLEDAQLLRASRVVRLEPGDEVPLTIAWHARDGEPTRVDWGRGSLAVPG